MHACLSCACMFLIKLNNVFVKMDHFLCFIISFSKNKHLANLRVGFGLWWSHMAFASPYQTYIPLPSDSGIIYTWALCLVSNWCEKIWFFFFGCFAFWDLIIGSLGMWVWFLNVDIFYKKIFVHFFQCCYDDYLFVFKLGLVQTMFFLVRYFGSVGFWVLIISRF